MIASARSTQFLGVLELGKDEADDSQPQHGGDLLVAFPI